MNRSEAVPPEAVRAFELDVLLQERVVAAGVARVAAAAVGWLDGEGRPHVWLGAADARGPAQADPHRVFDLASVSKPLLALLVARAEAAGKQRWAQPLATILPELSGTRGGDASVEALLSHRAGLLAHIELFEPLRQGRAFRRAELLRRAASSVRSGEPPYDALYSDLGYLLVGAALERLGQSPLDRQLEAELAQPFALELGSARWFRAHAAERFQAVAPTEIVPFRGGLVRGVVHDENAWCLAGSGFAGHAGLFGTASALARLGLLLLASARGEGQLLTAEQLAVLTRVRPGGTLRLGFDGVAAEGSSAGPGRSAETFGHLGFTGTSLWCDPRASVVTVLLTNRVYPTRVTERLRKARPALHAALFGFGERAGAAEASGSPELWANLALESRTDS